MLKPLVGRYIHSCLKQKVNPESLDGRLGESQRKRSWLLFRVGRYLPCIYVFFSNVENAFKKRVIKSNRPGKRF